MAPGWYGKLAFLGDFTQRRVPAHWVTACDVWLSASMRAGEERLRERWVDAYRAAPMLRFAWAPGVIDAQWWFGLLMPSADSVGRHFPLLITQPRALPPEDRIALDHLELWLDQLEQAAQQTRADPDASVDAFDAMLLDAPPWPTPGPGRALAGRSGASGERSTYPAGMPLHHALGTIAAELLMRRLAGCTVWWRTDGAADSIDIVAGLPDGARFVELIGGA